MKLQFVLVGLCVSSLLFGCGFYGTVYSLKPEAQKNPDEVWENVAECNDASYVTTHIFMEQRTFAYTILGIPYLPGVFDFFRDKDARTHIYYLNFVSENICNNNELIIFDEIKKIEYKSLNVWKSKVGATEKGKTVGCFYNFGDIGRSERYTVKYSESMLGCKIPNKTYVKFEDKGHQMYILQ